jgi:peptidoglycan/LPS O-acetylase OafA/YrhL
MQRSAGLDLMRATAITLVLLQHFLDLVRGHSSWVLPFYGWAAIGVEIFFALSGFLIGRILLGLDAQVTEPGVLLGFWTRRWLRTLPVCYVMLLVRLLVMMGCLNLSWKTLGILPRYFAFLQCWAWPYQSGFFEETWSLAVEEWFYLLFPLIWVAAISSRMKPFKAFVLASVFMLLASTIMRLGAMPLTTQDWFNNVYPVTIYRFDSIAFGLLAAALSVARPRIWTRWRWPGLVFGLGLLWLDRRLMLLDVGRHVVGYLGAGHCSVTGLGSVLLLPWCSSVEKLFWPPLQNLIGLVSRWSYSLYLTHGMLIALAWIMFSPRINESAAWAWALLALLTCLSFMLAGALHCWVEKPGMRLRERLKLSRKARVDPV